MPERNEFGGINEGYILELYERFRQNPESVDPATRAAFERAAPASFTGPESGVGQGFSPAESYAGAEAPAPHVGPGFGPAEHDSVQLQKIVGTVNLAESIRKYGHLGARLDPLGSPPWGDPALAPESHGVSEPDLRALPASL